MGSESSEASAATLTSNEAVRLTLPFQDRDDFADAQRGFVASLDEPVIRTTSGRVVWDLTRYADQTIDADCPTTVNPSLWRQAQLNSIHGLFEVADGIYQVRGLDLSNMTIIEGTTGIIVFDPLISCETAAAALALYRAHRGDRPVTAVLYTHSHVDHFGGVKGIVDESDVVAGRIPVIAPDGFLEHAVAENVYAGTAMSRRAQYMYGALLDKGPRGQVDAGLGKTTSLGRISLIAPTLSITRTGEEHTIDGVRLVFQLTPGTEAPAEMNIYLPDHRALCAAENATHNLHNVVTLRGALVRDALVWSKYLDEMIELYVDDTDVLFAQHHWPCWGRDRIVAFLSRQRDLYRYLHDQTLRLMNQGYTGIEIAEMMELPAELADTWSCRGYYGSVSHNVKAIYQRYLGWFDGHPANLWPLPPDQRAPRYVEAMGGADAVVGRARAAADAGEYRWAAELLTHVVFADPGHVHATQLQADVFEQLGYQSENSTWRNFYLMGAQELRGGVRPFPATVASPELFGALSIEQVFDAIGGRLDGPRAAGTHLIINWTFTDVAEQWFVRVENGAFGAVAGRHHEGAGVHLTMARPVFDGLVLRTIDPAEAFGDGRITAEGEVGVVLEFFGLLDVVNPNFPIVTP